MTYRIEAAKLTMMSVVGGSANYAVATAAMELNQQLNQTHPFLYLDLPIWIFFTVAFFLAIVGSLASLFIDLMSDPPLPAAHLALNLVLGFLTGIVGAFVLLPTLTANPQMPLLLLTALSMSFLGTVLVRNVGEVLRSAELWQSIKVILKNLIVERIESLVAFIFGGRKK